MTAAAHPPLLSEVGGEARTTWVVGIVALAFVLTDLTGRTLHDLDTARWGTLAREMIRTGEWLVPTRYGELYVNKPPLYLWAVAAPSALWGEVMPLYVRLPAALGFVLMVLATASWARLRIGTESAARTAGLVALSTFAVAWLAREGRLDMMGAGLATAGTVAWDRVALGRGSSRTPWVAGLWLGAAILVKGPPLLLVPACVLCAHGKRLANARIPLVLGVAIGVACCWFVPALWRGGWEAYGRPLLFDQASTRLVGAGNHLHPWWQYLVELPARMVPWGPLYILAFVGVLAPRVRRSLGPVAPVAAAGLAACVLFSLVPTKHIRYLAPVVPMGALAVSWWAQRFMEAQADRPPVLSFLPMVGTTALGCAVGGAIVVTRTAGFPDRSPVHGFAWGALVPLVALVGIGAVSLRRRRMEPTTRRAVAATLGIAICLVLLTCTVRYRFRDRPQVLFNLAVARHLAETAVDADVRVLWPLRPQDVFLGAPQALSVRTPGALPSAAVWVVLRQEELPALRAARRVQVLIPASASTRGYTLVRAPPQGSG